MLVSLLDKILAVHSLSRYLFPAPAKSGAGIGLLKYFIGDIGRASVFFYVVCLAMPNYGGLGGGTARCAGVR